MKNTAKNKKVPHSSSVFVECSAHLKSVEIPTMHINQIKLGRDFGFILRNSSFILKSNSQFWDTGWEHVINWLAVKKCPGI